MALDPSCTGAPSPDQRKQWRRKADRLALQRDRELEAARRISETLFQHTEVDELVEITLQTALEEVAAEAGSILLADPETRQLVFHHSIGVSPVPRGTAIPWDQGVAGRVFQTNEPALTPDVKQSGHHFAGIDEATGYTTRDMISLPLKRWKGDPIGVLNVLNKRNGTLNEGDLALLTIVSAFAALLVINAIPEVPKGGSILVSGCAEESGQGIVVSVADTGRGMPKVIRERLFSARAISTKPGGTGLGTKIIKDAIAIHKGEITVESEEGVGTTFRIRLPMDPAWAV